MTKTAKISFVRSSDPHGFHWVWRSTDGKHRSRQHFVYYYECVEDARRAGFTVDLPGTTPMGVDGAPRHGMQ